MKTSISSSKRVIPALASSTSSSTFMNILTILTIICQLLLLLQVALVASAGDGGDDGDAEEQVRRRVYEQIDNFMSSAPAKLQSWNDYFELEVFEHQMDAPDRTVVSKYLFSTVKSSKNFLPFYGLENGFFTGYLHSGPQLLSALHYREPGEAGYDIYGINNKEEEESTTKGLHFNTCVNGETGTDEQCIMADGDLYVACNNGCELVRCPDDDSQRDCSVLSPGQEKDDCESHITWCRDYSILEAKMTTTTTTTETSTILGYIPMSVYCYNSQAVNSQEEGEIIFLNSETGILDLGDCRFGSGDLVNRQVPAGPYADCGWNGTICDTTFVGAYTSSNYDPRYRIWYIDSKAVQRPRWSDAYVFANAVHIGITATHPLFIKDIEGRTLLHGVLAADILLGEISEFLITSFKDTDLAVAIYEVAEPNYMIGTSTGSDIVFKVQKDDPTQLCSDEQDQNGECTLNRTKIEELDGTTEDIVLRNAYLEIRELVNEEEMEGSHPNDDAITVKEDPDDITSQAYLATYLVYEQPGANLKWITIVTAPLDRDTEDAILLGDSLFVLNCVLASLGCAICFSLFLLFFWHRHEKAVMMADYYFTAAFTVMCALLNLASLSHLGERNNQNCMISMWVSNMMIAMTLSPLYVKSFRTWRLLGCDPGSSSRLKMSNLRAWTMTIPIPLLEAIILMFATIFNPPQVNEFVNNDGSIPVQSLTCEHDDNWYFIIQAIYYFFLVASGCILAFLTRNIDGRFADAKGLIFVMYNIAFTVIMLVAITFLAGLSYDALVTIETIGMFWITVFSAGVFVLPRVMQTKRDRKIEIKERSLQRLSRRRSLHKISSVHVSNAYDEIHHSEESLKVLVCSANIGNAEPNLSSMRAWLPELGRCQLVSTLDGQPLDAERFDLVVIGMQESTWTPSNKSKKIPESAEPEENGGTGGGGVDFDASAHYTALVQGEDTMVLQEMVRTILGDEYDLVKAELRGQMRLHIWALTRLSPFLDDIKVSGANTGIGNVLANKGGIVVSFKYQKTRFSFLAAHLAAHEGESHYQDRCANVRDILHSSKTFELSKKFDLALGSHHMFVFGDLNFRTKFEEKAEHEENVQRALDLIKEKDFDTLYSYDELHKGVKQGDLLMGFQTLPCHFHPTFKVQREPGFVYKEQRTPSYTDRILFKSSAGLKDFVKPLSYEPCVDFVTSDHKPIRGAFSIVTNEMVEPVCLDCRFRMEFSEMECSDLPAGDMDGYSDPFLMFIWDSIDMKEETSRGFRFHHLFTDTSWPHTRYLPKTLNPQWTGKKVVLVSTGHDVDIESVLFVSAFDYDFGSKANVLGTLPLSILDLVNMKEGESHKELNIDQPLQANGMPAGRIKFKLAISKFIG